jgi:hypothetical protein
MVVVAEVSVPGAALDGEGVSVQVRLLAVPSFWMEAVNGCVLPAVNGPLRLAGLRVMVVAGMLKFVVAQTVGAIDAHPDTETFCAG